jgi:DNA-binding MarR family transcriptional regulator
MKTPSMSTIGRNRLPLKPSGNDVFSGAWERPNAKGSSQNNELQTTPVSIIHTMLFALEFIQGANDRSDHQINRLKIFFVRAGGVHLLLLLLNAYYYKTPVGRMPGWTFGMLHKRVRVSRRTLRKLICDAVNEGLVVQMSGRRDKRCKVYVVTEDVVEAWEKLSRSLDKTVSESLVILGNNELANVDYRS